MKTSIILALACLGYVLATAIGQAIKVN